MNEELNLNAEDYKVKAINHIKCITFDGMAVLVTIPNPPPVMLASLRYAQLILAGNA